MYHNKQELMEKFGFPGVNGITNGTHIAISKPTVDAYNFYSFYSLNTLTVCDANLKILSILTTEVQS